MRICLTSCGRTLDSKFDQRFGRSQYLLVVDPSTLEVQTLDNPGFTADHGAGTVAAQSVLDAQVHVLITGHLGDNAEELLSRGRLACYQGSAGTVQSVMEDFTAGQLKRLLPLPVGSEQ